MLRRCFYSQAVVVAVACFLCQDKAIDIFVKVSVLLKILLRRKQWPRASNLANQLLPEVDIFFTRRQIDLDIVDNFAYIYLDSLSNYL
ncbi:hypothetical protein PMIT1306_01201 [Prochlorococcus sp. MIT 1306]|nr:hypothetical protein PMIT1306_01201 [Prochlorococcus sp. MIT 1306]